MERFVARDKKKGLWVSTLPDLPRISWAHDIFPSPNPNPLLASALVGDLRAPAPSWPDLSASGQQPPGLPCSWDASTRPPDLVTGIPSHPTTDPGCCWSSSPPNWKQLAQRYGNEVTFEILRGRGFWGPWVKNLREKELLFMKPCTVLRTS